MTAHLPSLETAIGLDLGTRMAGLTWWTGIVGRFVYSPHHSLKTINT